MSNNKNITKSISQEDINVIKNMAIKYNMSVVDFGRTISRLAEYNLRRWIRLTAQEHITIKNRAIEHGTTITHWCSLACHVFLSQYGNSFNIYGVSKNTDGVRCEKICITLRNRAEDAKLVELAKQCSIGISTLIRYCVLQYDGNSIKQK